MNEKTLKRANFLTNKMSRLADAQLRLADIHFYAQKDEHDTSSIGLNDHYAQRLADVIMSLSRFVDLSDIIEPLNKKVQIAFDAAAEEFKEL